jgi:hypothetical protein
MNNDYEVGYGKPPRHTRFKKGHSGNPKGRPRGSRNLKSELEDEFRERIVVREGGKARKVSKRRAMIKAQMAKAVQGDTKAATLLTSLEFRYSDLDPRAEGGVEDIAEKDQAILENYIRRHQSPNRESIEAPTQSNGTAPDNPEVET